MDANGFVYVRGVLSAESVRLFAEQINAELQQTGPAGVAAATSEQQVGKKRKVETKTTWAEDRTTPSVSLDDKSTWPRKGTRRVVELAPLSVGMYEREE